MMQGTGGSKSPKTMRERCELVVDSRAEPVKEFCAAAVQDQLALLLARAAMQD